MIEVRLANNKDEEILKNFNLKIEEIVGDFCFIYIDDLKPKGYSLIRTEGKRANIADFQLQEENSNKLFFLKSIGMNLRDFGIEEFYDNNGLVKSFFENQGKINFNLLFRGSCNDL
ncbi:hypothetical protein [Finegoldia magna]|uniref:hypothetical protein n=1 Tax=Finegoldia magna TaxID=1260 RepID=UPI001D1422F0|nr:hypothetical protein [Finegoldia magna]UEB33247.1 hypothetical protein LK404_07880 [Finegoldia magna]